MMLYKWFNLQYECKSPEELAIFRRILPSGTTLLQAYTGTTPDASGRPVKRYRFYHFFEPTYGTLLHYLRHDVKTEGFSEQKARRLFRQVIELVDYAHAKQILFKIHSLLNFVFADEKR